MPMYEADKIQKGDKFSQNSVRFMLRYSILRFFTKLLNLRDFLTRAPVMVRYWEGEDNSVTGKERIGVLSL